MASNLLNIVCQQSNSIDEEKLRIFCTKCNIWDHFKMSREQFHSAPEHEQMKMLHRFYNDLEPVYFAQNKTFIDPSISENIKNSSKMTMTKVIEDNRGMSEIKVSADKDQEKKNSETIWPNHGYFGFHGCDFAIEKANLPENTIFYINQGYLSYKDSKKIYYSDIFIIEQIILLLHQPKNIDDYVLKENEVEILRPRYNLSTGEFLGLENCIAFLTVCNDQQEQLFDYGYTKENSTILYSVQKNKIPNLFKTTIFNKHKIQYEAGAFTTDMSDTFFFSPSTVDRVEKINRHMGSVNLRLFDIQKSDFGEEFNPATLDLMRPVGRESVLKVLKNSPFEFSKFKEKCRCLPVYCLT